MTYFDKYVWDETEHIFFERILEEIIPESSDGRIPSAKTIGVLDDLNIKLVENNETNLIFQEGLNFIRTSIDLSKNIIQEMSSDELVKVINIIEKNCPKFFEFFLRNTYMIYYSKGSIRSYFGLSTNPPHPNGYDVEKETPEEMDVLVKPVLDRGHCYRDIN